MKPKNLTEQTARTYKTLRVSLAVIAFAFPPFLSAGGYFRRGLGLAGSMSAYYHASISVTPGVGAPGQGVMRDVFVGLLFAVGALLFAYQGYSRREDYALDLAGVLACLIAVFPMNWLPKPDGSSALPATLHGTFAVLFFACIAYVCIFCATSTLREIHDETTHRQYVLIYRILGLAMIISPLSAWILSLVLEPLHEIITFVVELIGIYVFAGYWIVKSHEASGVQMEKRVASGEFQMKSSGKMDVLSPPPLERVKAPDKTAPL